MYILPKVEGRPAAGYWGYIVAVSKEPDQLPAMMESRDGITWAALSPARTRWGATPKKAYLEYGGCERIGGKYYLKRHIDALAPGGGYILSPSHMMPRGPGIRSPRLTGAGRLLLVNAAEELEKLRFVSA